MKGLAFKWEVCRAGYEIREDGIGRACLWPRSQDFDTRQPLVNHPALFRQFAALEPTEAAFTDFASRFGLLTHPRDEEAVATWHAELGSLKMAVSYWERGLTGDLERLVNSLSFVSLAVRIYDGVPAFEPKNLRDAMWIQLALSIARREGLRECLWCKTWFAYGPGTGRRETAVYCSPKCQKAHAYQKRKEAARGWA